MALDSSSQNGKKLGRLLVERGWITGEQLIRAIQSQRLVGGRLGTCLLEMDVLSEDRLLSALADQLGVPSIRIDQLRGIGDEVLDLIPAPLAERCQAVPFAASRHEIEVATLDVHNLSLLDELSFCTNRRVRPHIANEARIFEALEKYYGVECPRRYGHLLDRLNRSRYMWDESAKILLGATDDELVVWTPMEEAFDDGKVIRAASSRSQQTVTSGRTATPAPAVVLRQQPPYRSGNGQHRRSGPPTATSASHNGKATPPSVAEAAPAPTAEAAPVQTAEATPPSVAEATPPSVAEATPPSVAEATPPSAAAPLTVAPALATSPAISVATAMAEKPATATTTATSPPSTVADRTSVSEHDRDEENRLTLEEADRLLVNETHPRTIAEVVLCYLSQNFDRSALFQVKGDGIFGWLAEGPGIDVENFQNLHLDPQAPSVFLDLAKGAEFHLGPLAPMPVHRQLARVWGGELPRRCVLMAIRVRKRLVAILYADRRASNPRGIDIAELKHLTKRAAGAFERSILQKRKLRDR